MRQLNLVGPAVVRAGAGEAAPLSAVRAAIISCDRCPRLRDHCLRIAREKRRAYLDDVYWARPVPGFGDPRARLLLVGLAPAAHGANRTGRLFTGDGVGGAGDFLMTALHRAGFANIATSRHPGDGLKLRDAFITAVVRCAPPDNKPTREEIERCLPHLEAELAALPRVRVIVALGRIAFEAYLSLLRQRAIQPARDVPTSSKARVARTGRPQFGHGSVHALANGQTLIGCYHPSRQNTNTGRLTPPMLNRVFRLARLTLERRR